MSRPRRHGFRMLGLLGIGFALGAVVAWPGGRPPAAAADLSPPGAALFIDGRGPFAARVGDHCLFRGDDGGCVDRRPPAAPAHGISGGDALVLRLDQGWRIERWDAGYLRYADGMPQRGPVHRLARGRAPTRDGLAEIAFTGPPPGDWRVDVLVAFHGMRAHGDVSLQWRLRSMPNTGAPAGVDEREGHSFAIAAVLATPAVFGMAWALASGRLRRRDLA